MINAPIKSAVARLPGRPMAKTGIRLAGTEALSADSAAATPSGAPWPNISGVFEVLRVQV